MNPIEFKGCNEVFGKDQQNFKPLPAILYPDGQVTTCWELSDEEIEILVKTKKLFISQLTNNEPLQAILPHVELEDNIEVNISLSMELFN